ncbi:olfactory receptor 1E16-like [Lepisosteus oculatus]|uniref:olfactory receptor 1E16-like n=1 Tax=Lepisosteus oculatus TaxID=7918 RepID=UPI0037113C54
MLNNVCCPSSFPNDEVKVAYTSEPGPDPTSFDLKLFLSFFDLPGQDEEPTNRLLDLEQGNIPLYRFTFQFQTHIIKSGGKSLSLVVMSYERLVSICFPLRSSTINTNTRMFIIIVFCWLLAFSYFTVAVVFIARLSFCRPVPVIKSYFCDHGPVFKEACSSYSANWTIASVYTVAFIFLPFALIIISYVCIIVALSRIASAQGRWKAFKTCTAHLALVVIFFIPVLVTYMIVWTNLPVDTDSRILNTSLAATLPPLLNPIIYTLKTEEVMEQIKNFLRKQKAVPVLL